MEEASSPRHLANLYIAQNNEAGPKAEAARADPKDDDVEGDVEEEDAVESIKEEEG